MFEGCAGSEKFIPTWLEPWLVRSYGKAARSLKPHGVIVLDTIMEYNTTERSQALPIPQQYVSWQFINTQHSNVDLIKIRLIKTKHLI